MKEEMAVKMSKAKSVEEILAIAGEYDVEMTREQAQQVFDYVNGTGSAEASDFTGELSDDDLDAVAGGVSFDPFQVLNFITRLLF